MDIKPLDLHRVRHADVERSVELFVNANWGSGQNLKIITGHSQAMRDLVIEVLNTYKVGHSIGGPLGNDNTYILTEEV